MVEELRSQTDAQGRPHGVWEDYFTDDTLDWRPHYHHGELIRKDSDEKVEIWNTIISKIGQPAWFSLPADCLLFLFYTDII